MFSCPFVQDFSHNQLKEVSDWFFLVQNRNTTQQDKLKSLQIYFLEHSLHFFEASVTMKMNDISLKN